MEGFDGPVAGHETLHDQEFLGHRTAFPVDQIAGGAEVPGSMLGAQIGGDDFLVALHLLRRPRGDQLAIVKDVDGVGDIHD